MSDGKIVPISWQKFVKFLLFIGCVYKRPGKGSHKVYMKAGLNRPVIVTSHGKIPIFEIKSNLRTLGISTQQYLEILKEIK